VIKRGAGKVTYAARMRHRQSSHSWGMSHRGALTDAARQAERFWRWPVLLSLICTIPAFYIELLEDLPTPLAVAIYAGAALVLAMATRQVMRRAAWPLAYLRHNLLDLCLIIGLLVSAVLPPSAESNVALAARLVVAMMALMRMVWTLKALVTRGSIAYLLMIAMTVLVFCGIGFWALEPTAKSLGDGLWLAFTTAATVGYGDMVPSTPASKIFAFFVVLLGYAVLSLVTAAIAAFWVESSEREMEADILRQVHAELQSLRDEVRELKRQPPQE
jgi:voltage-gated potassium channel